KNLMILLRHDALWNTRNLYSDADNSFTKLYMKAKNERSKLCFPPIFSSTKSINDSSSNLNTSDPKASVDGAAPPHACSDWFRCIAPRQKFLLLFVEDRYMSLYLYNWNSSFSTSIVGLFCNLIVWHNSRSLLLQSL